MPDNINSGISSVSDQANPKKRSILIIDDEPMIIMILTKILSDFGYHIRTATNCSDGRTQIRTTPPDLILLDVMLPDGNGLDFCGEIKSDPEFSNISIIMMSGVKMTPDEQAKGLDAGADDYVAKPLHHNEIIARIESLFRIKRTEAALRKSEQRYRALFNSMLNGFFLSQVVRDKQGVPCDFIYVDVNPSFESITGFKSPNVLGRNFRAVLQEIEQETMDRFFSVVETGNPCHFEDHLPKLGKHIEFMAYRPEQDHLAVTFSDITKRKKTEEKLNILATTDELTGLWNRRYFMRILRHEMERGKRYNNVFSVLMLDIDHFKKVNDEHGHAAGDKALEHLAQVIKKHMRQVDVPCRFGGEEFAIIIPHTNLEGSYQIAERLRRFVQDNPINYQNKDIFFTISIGLAQYEQTIADEDELLKSADDALYQAKRNGRNLTVKAMSPS
jgi:two-component system, cell cycle response regulator